MPNLAKLVAGPERQLGLRMAKVQSVQAGGTITVFMGADTSAVAEVPRLSSYAASVDDICWILQNGTDLMAIGKIGGNFATAWFGDGLELYHPTDTPYIDFHRGANPADDGGADYNMRIINDAAGRLNVYGGQLRVDSTSVDNIWAAGSGATVRIDARDGPTFIALYRTGSRLAIWNNVYSVDRFEFFDDGEFRCPFIGINGDNDINIGIKINSADNLDGVRFSTHISDWKLNLWPDDYALGIRSGTLCVNTGEHFEVRHRPLNSRLFIVNNTEMSISRNVNINGKNLYLKGAGDDAHRIYWDSSYDGFRYRSWVGHAFHVLNVDFGMELQSNRVLRVNKPLQNAAWDQAAIRSENDNNGSAAYSFHCLFDDVSTMELWPGDGWVYWKNGGGGIQGVHLVVSTDRVKYERRNLGSVREEIKKIKPFRFKQKRPTDPTAPPFLAKDAQLHRDWQEQIKEGRWSPSYVALVEREWERDHIGVSAEEMYEVFPEVVRLDAESKPLAVDYSLLSAVLWRYAQEQDEAIEDLQRRVAVIERLPAVALGKPREAQ